MNHDTNEEESYIGLQPHQPHNGKKRKPPNTLHYFFLPKATANTTNVKGSK